MGLNLFRNYNRKYYSDNKERLKKQSKERNEYNRRIVLEHYGGSPPRCQCCGMDIYEFLSLDHIDGGKGSKIAKERRTRKQSGTSIYFKIIKDGFPSGLRILCFNCNLCIAHYGRCVHEEMKELDKCYQEALRNYLSMTSSSKTESEKTSEISTPSQTQ